MIFYLILFVFILSLIIGLILMITGKDMRREKFLLLSTIHLIFIFAFIASLILRKNDGIGEYNYFFTAFICSGIILRFSDCLQEINENKKDVSKTTFFKLLGDWQLILFFIFLFYFECIFQPFECVKIRFY